MSNFRFKSLSSGKVFSVTASNYVAAKGFIKAKLNDLSIKFQLLKITECPN